MRDKSTQPLKHREAAVAMSHTTHWENSTVTVDVRERERERVYAERHA